MNENVSRAKSAIGGWTPAVTITTDPRLRGREEGGLTMRRPMLARTLSIGIGLVLVACAGPGGTPGKSAGSQPSVAAGQSEVPAASQAAASHGGASGGEAPALADGKWTGGQGKTTVSGAVSHTTDAPLTTTVSVTKDAETLLAYNTEDTFVTININALGIPFSAAVTAPDWDASAENCQVTYARADDTGIDATFSCVVTEFIYMGAGDDPTGEITIKGSFTATR